MNCHCCGGPVSQAAGRSHAVCEFCGTRVRLETTGASTDRIVFLAGDSDHHCPDCHCSLQNCSVDGITASACSNCYGILFQRESLQRAVTERRANYKGADTTPGPVDASALNASRNCPSCSSEMQTHVYYGPGNSVIDSCERCALIWLDAGELTEIEQAPGRRQVRQAQPLTVGSGALDAKTQPPGMSIETYFGSVLSLLSAD